jgi:hypothetical protein
MLVEITSPANSSKFKLGDRVSFQGSADATVVRVELFAEQYLLGKTSVINIVGQFGIRLLGQEAADYCQGFRCC